MSVEIRVPRLAESISEAVLVEWLKPDGAPVATDQPVAVLETDKAAVEIAATAVGTLRHGRAIGDRVVVGDVIGRVEADGAGVAAVADAAPDAGALASTAAAPVTAAAVPASPARPEAPRPATGPAAPRRGPREMRPAPGALAARTSAAAAPSPAQGRAGPPASDALPEALPASAAVAPSGTASGPPAGAAQGPAAAAAPPAGSVPASEGSGERVVPMTRIRQRIAERLVRSQHTAAILTTFNEVDMSAVLALRTRLREEFERRHGVRLGLMSFFTRASAIALSEVPELNAEIRGTDIVYRDRVHMGVAVQTERGLVVPVVRGADTLSFAEIEREIARLADRAREAALSLDELSGGTFTISNGGVYGSLLSTPILNPPQSGILGMHKIEKRPIALNDQVAIRPMMYVALSYDHRIVDGEQAVTFLVHVKQRLEDPERMLLEV
jgi:2-oxoglutarate dehydrogenase E2 component (dihydrolipoamide succinyltransferase)